MKLTQIPQILALLEQKHVINSDQKTSILEGLDKAKAENRTAFAGEMGIEKGFYDKQTLDHHLTQQTALKAEAAVLDIQTIKTSGKQHAPAWLTANWGNNGVNSAAPAEKLTIADGVSATANIAQNIVMIANDHPHIMAEHSGELTAAISAAANLARGLVDGSSDRVPLDKKSQEWIKNTQDGLRLAVSASGYVPKDRNKNEINLETFIAERFKEIEHAVHLSLAKGQAQSTAAHR